MKYVYRPPNSTQDWIDSYEKQLSIVDSFDKEFYVLGDFNIEFTPYDTVTPVPGQPIITDRLGLW